jgi:transposase
MHKRVHSREFKLEIVRQIATGQKRPAQVCREYGLAESVLSRWRKEYQERGEAAFQPHQAEGTTSQEQCIVELEQFLWAAGPGESGAKKTLQRLESWSGMR